MNNASHHRDGMFSLVVFCAFLLLAFIPATNFAASSFTGLGDRFKPEALSGDGKVVVSHYGGQILLWSSTGGITRVGKSQDNWMGHVRAVSYDGSVVVGTVTIRLPDLPLDVATKTKVHYTQFRDEAFRWTAAGGLQTLGYLADGHHYSSADAVSSDGSVVVGDSYGIPGDSIGGAYRWTQATGMIRLGTLSGTDNDGQAKSVSGDGTVVVGVVLSASGDQAFRWTAATGMVGLGKLPVKKSRTGASAISKDGMVIVGFSQDEAFRWTATSGMVGLGKLRGCVHTNALALSGDGSVIVGVATLPLPWFSFLSVGAPKPDSIPFVWDNVNGMRDLKSVLTKDYNLDLTGWKLTSATGISADGMTIVGHGSSKDNGGSASWIAHLDYPVNAPPRKEPKK